MKKIIFLLCMMMGSVYADTTGSLTSNWSGVVTGSHPNNCCSGGPQPLYDPNTGIVHFSYGQYTISQTIAINNALSGSGVQIGGYNYQYDLRNLNGNIGNQGGTDTISVYTYMKDNQGITVGDSSVIHNTPFDWQTFRGTVNLLNELPLTNAGHMGIQFSSRDAGFWAGYYGPQVRNVSMSINYSAVPIDPCVNDPLSSPSCPGYQQAYHDQQCSFNPLHATTCPGYQQAYYNQQCFANPLYDSGCPGYQQAYFNQQCTLNPLFSSDCPGYQQAYFNHQCSLNALYDSNCPGYQQAYFDQQCSLNGLYDRSCPNYAQAYATQQLLNQQNSSTQTASTPTVKTNEPEVQIKEDGKVSTDVPLVADPVVNSVLTKNTESKKEDKKTEEKKESTSVEKPKTNSARQAAIAAATKPDPATQTQSEKEFEQSVASQSAAVATLSFVPGFSAYQNAIVPDTNALLMRRQYDKPVVDNARAMRQLNGASDRLHNEMIQQQYR